MEEPVARKFNINSPLPKPLYNANKEGRERKEKKRTSTIVTVVSDVKAKDIRLIKVLLETICTQEWTKSNKKKMKLPVMKMVKKLQNSMLMTWLILIRITL